MSEPDYHERHQTMEMMEARIAELEAALENAGATWLAETKAAVLAEREAAYEDVLAFIRNGRWLHDEAPAAKLAREIEAGWKAHGNAAAIRARPAP